MIAKLLAYLMIIMGIVFLVKPDFLRKKLQRKSTKYIKRILFGVILFVAIMFISAGWRTPGILAKILIILGIIGVFKAVFFLKAKAAEKIVNWYINQKPIFFRIGGVVYVLMGICILFFK